MPWQHTQNGNFYLGFLSQELLVFVKMLFSKVLALQMLISFDSNNFFTRHMVWTVFVKKGMVLPHLF